MSRTRELIQELSERIERNGKGVERRGIKFQMGRRDWHMSLNGGANPNNAAATAMTAIGDAKTGECAPKERVARIDHRHRLFWR